MKTSAISNLANLASGSATAAKAPGDGSDASFSQALSREMAAPPKASEPPRADKAQNRQEPQAAQSAANEAKPAQQSDAGTPADSAVPESAVRSVKADKATAGTAAKAHDDEDQDDAPTVSPESEELLALVASLTQPAAKQPDAKAADDSKQAALDASDDGSAPDGQAKDILLLAQAAQPQNASPKAAADRTEGQSLSVIPGNQTISGKIDSLAASGQRRRESGLLQPAGTVANAARRSVTAPSGERAQAAGASEEASPEPDDFRTKLAQAKDEKTAPDNAAAKTQSGRSEFAAAHSADQSTSRMVQHAELPAVATITPNAATAAQFQPAQAMAAQASEMLAPRVGSPGWDQALSQKVVWMVGSDVQSASLTLNPPDLGPLQVVLHVSDNQATASFTAAQPEVRHALEAAMPKLREMLGDAGIQLGQANVNAGNPNNNPQNAFAQPQQTSRHGTTAADDSGDAAIVHVAPARTISTGEGLVNTFA